MFFCIATIFSLLTKVYITNFALKSIKINILLFMQVLLNCLLLLFNVVLFKVLPVSSDGLTPIQESATKCWFFNSYTEKWRSRVNCRDNDVTRKIATYFSVLRLVRRRLQSILSAATYRKWQCLNHYWVLCVLSLVTITQQ